MRRLIVATVVLVLAAAGIALGVSLSGSGSSPAAASGPATASTVLRPVHRDGTPAAGYRVVTEQVDGFTCDSGASPSAVDADIRTCGYTALGTISCWRSSGHTVLCLRDAYARELVRIRYTGSFAPVAAPAHPAPQAMTLITGTRCRIRSGGAWDTVTGHPAWVGGYWCGGSALYGPAAGLGIDDTHALWRVHEVRGASTGSQTVTPRSVSSAWLVGTAG